MQVVQRAVKATPTFKTASSSGEVRSAARVPLRMYFDAPSEEITLEEFEQFALDRLTGTCFFDRVF